MTHHCSICGYPALTEAPRSLTGAGSFEICPSCGYQFGVDDDDAERSHANWRADWLKRGAHWASKTPPPAQWDPATQAAGVTPKAGARLIVLTGGTRGCGRALVEYFARQGHIVAACGRTEKKVAELRAHFGAMHDFTALDVTDDEAVARWAARILATHGTPDLLVNNAATIATNAPLWRVPAAEIAVVLDVNVRGTVNVLRHFLPAMIAAGRGVIVNFSSGWGRSTSPEVAIYCASKFAIEGLTQALALELPPGLAAVAFNPGIIDTAMLRSCWADGAANYPRPAEWVKTAGPFLLKLSAKDNGKSLDVEL